jgi:hypothetical protein
MWTGRPRRWRWNRGQKAEIGPDACVQALHGPEQWTGHSASAKGSPAVWHPDRPYFSVSSRRLNRIFTVGYVRPNRIILLCQRSGAWLVLIIAGSRSGMAGPPARDITRLGCMPAREPPLTMSAILTCQHCGHEVGPPPGPVGGPWRCAACHAEIAARPAERTYSQTMLLQPALSSTCAATSRTSPTASTPSKS